MQQGPGARPEAGLQALGVRWIVDSMVDAAGQSTIASVRYRVLLPARALAARGHHTELVPLQELRAGQGLGWQGIQVLVIAKLFLDPDLTRFAGHSALLLQAARDAQAAGVTVVADINDDHFAKPVVGEHWKSLAALADVCIVGSTAMGATVAQHTDRPVVPVGDPTGSPKGHPRVYADRVGGLMTRLFRKEPLKLVWYGASDNVPAMAQWAQFLGAAWDEPPLQITLVTRPHPVVDALCSDFNRRCGKRAGIAFTEWSEAAQWAAVDAADVVLIPSDPADPRKAVKTANRLVDALHAGRHVIASPLPSYLPYADHATLTANPVQALHDYLNDPAGVRERIARGQAAVERDWGLEAVAQEWLAVFRRGHTAAGTESRRVVAAAPGPGPVEPPRAPIRLNLGCGDKILEGYVNVDVVEARAGHRPDVLSDLRDLSVFPDGHADEVMAIHVVEHFWRWEVEAVLREWVRVLRPGGELVLECPNLEAACAEFLRDPDAASGPGPEGQRSMWVFYGDPAWRDPLMVHRWGYTPRSLARLLEAIGLVEVHQAPAQFKLREPRDMRVVARKPVQ